MAKANFAHKDFAVFPWPGKPASADERWRMPGQAVFSPGERARFYRPRSTRYLAEAGETDRCHVVAIVSLNKGTSTAPAGQKITLPVRSGTRHVDFAGAGDGGEKRSLTPIRSCIVRQATNRRKAIMQREHRCCVRKALNREIMVGYSQTGFSRVHVRDIGLGGMRIEAAIPLAVNRPVELLIRASSNGTSRSHRWRATVRHVSPDGVGLKYEPFVLTELPALLELLQAADRQGMDCAGAGSPPTETPVVAAPSAPSAAGRRQIDKASGYEQ